MQSWARGVYTDKRLCLKLHMSVTLTTDKWQWSSKTIIKLWQETYQCWVGWFTKCANIPTPPRHPCIFKFRIINRRFVKPAVQIKWNIKTFTSALMKFLCNKLHIATADAINSMVSMGGCVSFANSYRAFIHCFV